MIFVYINMFSLFFLITYYAQNGLYYTVPQTSLVFLPLGLSFIATSLLSARWVRKKGNLVLIWGAALMGVSTIFLCLSVKITPQLLAPQNILLLFLYGAALGMTTTPLVGIVLIDLKAQFAGIGAAMLNTIMYLANALGVCFISFIFSKLLAANTYSTQLDNYTFSFSRSLIATAVFAGLTTCMLVKMTKQRN